MMKLNNMKIERELAAERSMLNSSNTSNKSISLSSISARVLSASKIEENRQIEREAVLAIGNYYSSFCYYHFIIINNIIISFISLLLLLLLLSCS